ncbi:MAG: hypothetical protein M3Q49_18120, partial [Actinomycetota bacterium]|nr:hypothetical protein [Actinomycetota bacterium]
MMYSVAAALVADADAPARGFVADSAPRAADVVSEVARRNTARNTLPDAPETDSEVAARDFWERRVPEAD